MLHLQPDQTDTTTSIIPDIAKLVSRMLESFSCCIDEVGKMAERKKKATHSEDESSRHTGEQFPKAVIGPGDRLRLIFEDLRAYAPPVNEDDGWETLSAAIDAERPEGMKLFSK
jgi:hypothetical protein